MEKIEIQPALSAEEWGRWLALNSPTSLDYFWTDGDSRPAATIAIANAGLPDSDPRKITRGRIAEMIASSDEADSQALHDFADALESYLPPA